MKTILLADELLREALQRQNIHLSFLVADTGLWVNPEFHHRRLHDTGSAAIHPCVRRAKKNEQRGQIIDGIRLDDNTYANSAIKRAMGFRVGQPQGFAVCHIWPGTCYDERYHTAAANIVLLPRAVAGFSDYDTETQIAIQYRSFELYNWWPEGSPKPKKPDYYPPKWREPQADPQESPTCRTTSSMERGGDKTAGETQRILSRRIRSWSEKPELNVHKIIALVALHSAGISKNKLVRRITEVTHSKNAYGAIASLLTNSGNAYGHVFEEVEGFVRLHPSVAPEVRACSWSTV